MSDVCRRTSGGAPTAATPMKSARAAVPPSAVSAIQPVRHLHQHRVRRMQPEEVANVTSEIRGALAGKGPLPSLVPHHEQRRSGSVLPAKYQVGLELFEVEPARIVCHR